MYIIVGLGNPGTNYAQTRHNVGFRAVDAVAAMWSLSFQTRKLRFLKFQAHVAEGQWGSERVVLVKPQTFMNDSGRCVAKVVNFYKVPLENLIVLYDDIDLDVGKLRIRAKGSGGSHNGMRSILEHLSGEQDFPRVRIGIGNPPPKWDLKDFVLSKFSKEEEKIIAQTVQDAAKAVEVIIREGVDSAMQAYNRKEKEPLDKTE